MLLPCLAVHLVNLLEFQVGNCNRLLAAVFRPNSFSTLKAVMTRFIYFFKWIEKLNNNLFPLVLCVLYIAQ